jgi:hypothetical protein
MEPRLFRVGRSRNSFRRIYFVGDCCGVNGTVFGILLDSGIVNSGPVASHRGFGQFVLRVMKSMWLRLNSLAGDSVV